MVGMTVEQAKRGFQAAWGAQDAVDKGVGHDPTLRAALAIQEAYAALEALYAGLDSHPDPWRRRGLKKAMRAFMAGPDVAKVERAVTQQYRIVQNIGLDGHVGAAGLDADRVLAAERVTQGMAYLVQIARQKIGQNTGQKAKG